MPNACKTQLCPYVGLSYLKGYCRHCFDTYHKPVEEQPRHVKTIPDRSIYLNNKDALELAFAGTDVMKPKTDPVVDANIKMLHERSQLGIQKYGTTLAGNPLSHRQWLQHALEEALDLANYLQAEIMKLDQEKIAHAETK